MTINSTRWGGGFLSLTSCLATLVLLLFVSTSAVSASPYVFAGGGGDTDQIDWTDPVRAFTQHESNRIQQLFAAEPQFNNAFAPCFTNFSAGDDETYCADDVATLNGGYDSYDSPGTVADQVGLQWSIIQGTGSLSTGLFGGPTAQGTNFSTTSNPGGGATVTYTPGLGDEMVILQLTAASNNSSCDGEMDEVTLFFDPFQEAAVTANVNGVDEVVDAGSATTNAAQFCAGSVLDLEITNNQMLENGQQDGAIPKFEWTVVAANGVMGFPVDGVGEAGAFNSAFENLTVMNNTGTSGTVTVSVVTFYDRGIVPNNMIDAGECEGPAVEFTFTVFPQAQATVSVNNGTANTFCEDETVEFRVTGSPNSTVTYIIDPATGSFGVPQTITLGASGTNGGVNGEAANFITVPLAGLGGGSDVRIRLTNVEYTSMPNCPRSLNFTRGVTVIDTPEGDISLTDADDADFCNGELAGITTDISYAFTTPMAAGTYELTIDESINGAVATSSTYNVTTTGAGPSTGTVDITFPATSTSGQTVTYTLTGITEAGSGLTCGGTVSGTPITVIEQPDPPVAYSVNDGTTTFSVSSASGNATSISVCDGTALDFSAPVSLASLVAGDDLLYFLDVSGDNFGFFGADRVLTASEVAALDAVLDIPNNAVGQSIQLEITAFYESDGLTGIGQGECLGTASSFLVIDIFPGITANVTTTPAAQQNNPPTPDLVTICSGEDVDFMINTNITTSGTANVVVDNGPNQVVNIGANGIGTFTLAGVTGPATFTLVDVTANGCTVEFNESVDVIVEAVPTGSVAVSDEDICLDGMSTVTFTGMGGHTGDYTYTVVGYAPGTTMPNILPTTVSGSSSVSISPAQFDFDTPGTYTFYLTRVENNSGLQCGTDYTIGVDAPTATVTVEGTAEIAVSSNTFSGDNMDVIAVSNANGPSNDDVNEICSGDNVTLTFTAESAVTSTSTGDQLYYLIALGTDETQSLAMGFTSIVPATAGGTVVLNQNFINTSATNEADVDFVAIGFYASSQPTAADVIDGSAGVCTGEILSFGFSVLPTPEADFGSNQTICANSSATIDFTGTPDAEVTVTVLSGMTNIVAGGNPQGGDALLMMGNTDVITLDNTGSAFFTTGDMTEDLVLRITQVESEDGCINNDILDVTIVVLDANDAAFTTASPAAACEGTSASLDIMATADSRVYYLVGSRVDSIDVPASGMVTLVTNPLASDSTYTITAVGKTVMNQSGNPVTCVNAPSSLNTSVVVNVEEAPNGTIVAVEPVCSGTEQPMLTFTQTAGNQLGGETFDIVINGQTYSVTDGLNFNTVPSTLTATTDFVLASITETTASSMGCSDAVTGPISTATVTVEAIPSVTAMVTLDGTANTVVGNPNLVFEFTDTVCSGTVLDFDLVGTPAMSAAGAPIAYRILLDDSANLLGFGAGMNDISLTATDFDANFASQFPLPLNNVGANAGPATIDLRVIPFYQTTPGNNQLVTNSCPGDTVAFFGTVLGELTADFSSMPQTICEDETATIDFSGTPNIEVSFFDGSQIITIETDVNGDASYTTVALTQNTTYTITGFSTLPGATNQCTRTIFNGPSQTVTVTPTPTLAVDVMVSDLEICNDGSDAVIGLTSNSSNAVVTYSIGTGSDQTFALTGTTGSLVISGLTQDTVVNFSLVTTDPNVAPVCSEVIDIDVNIVVRDLPDPVITNDGPVCAGNLVGLTFTDNGSDATGTYTVVVVGPANANYTGSPAASGQFTNGQIFTLVTANTVFTQVDVAGDYSIVAIRDNGVNPMAGCAPVANAAGLTTTTVVIDEEPVLNALVASDAGVVGLSQGGINAFNTTVCNGENLNVDFQNNTNPTSNSGNPLFAEYTMVSDPAGILTNYLPAENGTTDLNNLDLNQALVNNGTMPATVSFTVTPFYENGDSNGRQVDECAGRTLSFSITVLPQIGAEIISPLANTEVCDGDEISFIVEGTPNAQVTFSTVALTGLNVTSPATIPAAGQLTITGTADRSVNAFATLALSEVTLVTMINGVNKTCSETIISDEDVQINALPTGFLELSDNGPLCAGEDVTVIFRTSFASGDYTLTIGGTDYNVTATAPGITPVFVSNVFTAMPTADSTFTLTKIVFDDTGCTTEGMPIDDVTVLVNDVPAGMVTATDINSTITTATVAGETAIVCTGEGLTLNAAFDAGVSPPAGAANYVSVAYSGDGDYFGQGATSGTIALPAADFGTEFSAIFQNLSNSVQNASLVVTYYFETTPGMGATLDMGECTGETVTLNIEIQPNPIAAAVAMTICSNEAVDFDLASAITNGVTDVSFTYTVDPSASGLTAPNRTTPSSDNVVFDAGTLTNTTATDQTIVFTVTPATGATMTTPGCTGNDFTFTLTVQPAPALSNNLDATECSQEPIDIVLSTFGGTSAAGYNLVSVTNSTQMNFTPAAGNAAVGMGLTANAIQNDEFTNYTSFDQTVTYAVAPVAANGCIGDTVDVVATINPEPFVMNLRDTVCSGVRLDVDIIQDLVLNQVGRPASVLVRRQRLAGVQNFFVLDGNDNDDQVNFNANGLEAGGENAYSVISDSLINLTAGGIDLVYNIRVNNIAGCGRNEFTYTLRVVPEATATLTPVASASFCTGEDITLNAGIMGGSAPSNIQYVYSVLSADTDVQVILTPSGSSVNVAAGSMTASGSATIAVTVSDAATGCTATATQVVTVGVTPADNPIVGPAQPCINDFAQYRVRDRGNNYSFTLSNPNAGQIIQSVDTAFTILFNSNAGQGPFVLTMTETNPDGCVNTEDLTISLVTEAQADFFFQLNANNVPRRVAFVNNSAGNTVAYNWEFGTNGEFGTSTDEDPVVQFPDNTMNPGQPYDVDVTLTITGTCAPNVTSVTKTVTVNAVSICDDVALVPGVNFITFNVEPNDSLTTTVFAGVPGLVQVVGYDGGFPEVFVPGNGSANTLDTIRKGAGYVVIVDQASTVQACGIPIDPNFKRPLSPGVNYVGYMGITPVSSDSYFANLNMNPSVNFLVAQTFGNDLPNFAEVYVPGNGNANFQAMRPGRGYLIIVDGAVPAYRGVSSPTESFDFIFGSVSGEGFVAGSTVDVLNGQGEVIGQLATDSEGQFRATPVFGEAGRADGSFVDGLPEGEELSFRYNGEVIEGGLTFNGQMSVTEVNLNFTQAPVIVETPTTLSMVISPNPVSDQAVVTVSNDRAGAAEVVLMDVNGRVVTRLYQTNELPVGETRISWNDAGSLAPGIYSLIVLRDGQIVKEATTRVVKQ